MRIREDTEKKIRQKKKFKKKEDKIFWNSNIYQPAGGTGAVEMKIRGKRKLLFRIFGVSLKF